METFSNEFGKTCLMFLCEQVRPGQGFIGSPFNTGILLFFLSQFGHKVSCFSYILSIQFIDMN